MQNLADVNADLQPLSQLRRRHYQGTPAYASADLQPLSQLALPAPLTQGSLIKMRVDLLPQSATPPAPLTQGSLCGECRPTTPQSACAASSPYTGEPNKDACRLTPSVQLRRRLYQGTPAYASADLQPLSQLRRRHYQGTPAYASADLQPLSQLALPAPLTQGSLLKFA